MSLKHALKGAIKSLFAGELRIGRGGGHPFDPLESNGIVATCARTFPADRAFLAEWDALADSSKSATPFACSTWQRGVAAQFVASDKFRLITVRRETRLLAVLPLQIAAGGYLETPGTGVSDYIDPLVIEDAALAQEAWRAILSLLAKLWDHSVSGLVLQNVSAPSATRTLLPRLVEQAGFTFEETSNEPSVQITLPKTFEEYWETLDGHERRESRRRLRKAETQGNARLVSAADQADLSAWVVKGLDFLEAHGGDKAEDVRKYLRPFMMRVGADMIREGRMSLRFLMVNDTPAACVFSFRSPAGPMIYNVGFDPAQKQWSPGTVSSAIAIREAIEGGFPTFDFLRGTEDYKYRLGAKDVPLYRLILKRR